MGYLPGPETAVTLGAPHAAAGVLMPAAWGGLPAHFLKDQGDIMSRLALKRGERPAGGEMDILKFPS